MKVRHLRCGTYSCDLTCSNIRESTSIKTCSYQDKRSQHPAATILNELDMKFRELYFANSKKKRQKRRSEYEIAPKFSPLKKGKKNKNKNNPVFSDDIVGDVITRERNISSWAWKHAPRACLSQLYSLSNPKELYILYHCIYMFVYFCTYIWLMSCSPEFLGSPFPLFFFYICFLSICDLLCLGSHVFRNRTNKINPNSTPKIPTLQHSSCQAPGTFDDFWPRRNSPRSLAPPTKTKALACLQRIRWSPPPRTSNALQTASKGS